MNCSTFAGNIASRAKRLQVAAIALTAVVATSALVLPKAAIAGADGGPKRATNRIVSEGDCNDYEVRFRRGEVARVAAAGNGDIDIKIYDSDGDLVVSDTDGDFTPIVSWVPSYTETYTICVENADDYDVNFSMRTN